MFKNYFKVTWRNLFRNKSFSLINITGLAIGMASAVLIFLWIQNELSYDLFHKKKDRIYQLYNRAVYEGRVECWASTPQVLAAALKSDYPQVEEAVRVNWVGAFVFHAGDKHLETQGYITDPAFLQVFDFPLVKGDAATALNGPHSIVLTEKMAQKLFGTTNVIGKEIRVDTSALFTVTGVMKDLPNNTRFNFEYLIPWSYMKTVHWDRDSWKESGIETYALLKPGVSEETANERFRNIVRLHARDAENEIFVHPLRKWRLYSRFENGKVAGGYIETVRLFGIIAGFILLIACINYMNLSTARSEKRAREVGIRKVAGAGKGLLIGQFIGESIMIAFFAGILALLTVQLSIGRFSEITWKTLYVPYTNPYFWLLSAGFIVFTGIVAGSYPAFYLSAHKPVSVLKGTFKAARALVTPRKVLVVLQFSFAIILIISTIVIYRQIRYAQDRNAGYDKDQLAFIFAKGNLLQHYHSVREDLVNSGAVKALTFTSSPISSIWNDDNYTWAGKTPDQNGNCIKVHADSDFAGTMGLQVTTGRDLDLRTYPSDSAGILLNESAVKLMGFKDPVGQTVRSGEGDWHVVGVVKDFILGSPYQPVQPVVIQGAGRHSWFGTITFKLNGKNATADNLKKIEAVFKKYNPDYPFVYYFADDAYAQKFDYERRTAVLAGLFAGLTIFISCLGLFALAAYMAESRIKEIGVRKVLGASVAGITALLSVDFLKLVIIAFMIASPVAWWCMNNWLQDYTYRAPINWWIFALTGLLSMLIAIATISYQAIRAALANPVKSLRTE